ncbi:MAG: ABC transporter ATP-binding protein [Ruminococcus sp.]|nr:ABC transporter ATP-binding protein [Ruminococcus sp.]
MEKGTEILSMKNITKIYSNGVLANSHVDFSVGSCEIHALLGENGAGKSTLMKVLFGIEQPDEGTIGFLGKQVKIGSSDDALKLGIGMVHQHFKLVPSLTVAENIVLGKEPKKHGFLDRKKAVEITKELSERFRFDVDPSACVQDLSVGKKQKVEILKALYRDVKLLILDEPTAVLTPQETEELFEQLNKLREAGLTIIFISHKLNEVKQICQRITIMRHGKSVGTYDVAGLTVEDISRLMVGRDIILDIDKKAAKPKEARLFVKDLSCKNEAGRQSLDGISFSVRSGEILGIAGVEGSGQEELVELITGMKPLDQHGGEIRLRAVLPNGNEVESEPVSVRGLSVKQIRQKGISYIPEDRMIYGCAGHVSIRENLISSIYDSKEINSGLFLNQKKIGQWVHNAVENYDIRCDSALDEIGMLSGGNMQKVIVAREFSTNPAVLIADQPTRGVDVGAIEFIHRKIVEIRDQGCAVLLVSADLNEVLELSDSILVMCQGKISGYFPFAKKVSEEELGYYMLGVKKQPEEELRRAYSEE